MKEFKLTLGGLGGFISELTRILQSSNKPQRVIIKEWREQRSITANAQYHKWLPSIAKHYGEDVEFIRKWMKHTIAWPILERGGCEYSIKVGWLLEKSNYSMLDLNQQINLIDMFKITSVMDSKQHTDLRDELQIYWSKQGLNLEYLNK